jgi:cytochrome c peroxidase
VLIAEPVLWRRRAHFVEEDRSLKRLALTFVVVAVVLGAVALHLTSAARPLKLAATPMAPLAADTTVSEPIQPLPHEVRVDPRAVTLGRDLFHDVRLSRDNSISCASCHGIAKGGVDGMPRSVGFGATLGVINAPTVLNSGFNFRQFWNGRAATLEVQVDGPTHAPAEMNATWPMIIEKLHAEDRYVARFAQIYREGLTPASVRHAIASYERSLVTPSRFDRYLRGDASAITDRERAGYQMFKDYGCASCHQGVNAGANMYQVFGVMHDYFASRDTLENADLGRFSVTHDERDRHVFKVPSLRNVALTAPYFHDASAASLPAAVSIMGWYQLGRPLSSSEVGLLVDFLGALTGELPRGALPDSSGREPS